MKAKDANIIATPPGLCAPSLKKASISLTLNSTPVWACKHRWQSQRPSIFLVWLLGRLIDATAAELTIKLLKSYSLLANQPQVNSHDYFNILEWKTDNVMQHDVLVNVSQNDDRLNLC